MKMPADVIREEIRKSGGISFARFMELALYCPETGYYEKKEDNIGRAGDFITSVSVGSLFGELLAFQLADWLEELNRAGLGGPLAIVEAGAHDGRLAADILSWLQANRRELFARLEYFLVEPSARRQAWQREKLQPFAGQARWCTDVRELAGSDLRGVLFGNELLDAFPVRRFGWDAAGQRWYEWGVELAGEGFQWLRLDASAAGPEAWCPAELLPVLPNGFVVETSPAAESWWRAAAGLLAHGRLMAIDYGYTAEEMISPSRANGTLRAYRRHQVTHDLLADPGSQDLTAHVNFAAIQRAGEAAGWRTESVCPQPRFLTQIFQRALAAKCFTPMKPKQVRQFQTLTHPEHLGRAFRVLVQAR
jgi:SAM-dependent MidA family methyltransferase